jgi:glutamate synthase (NADPH/NADH) small chain
MQDPRSFIHVPRQDPDRQSPRLRLRHWQEYESMLPEHTAAEQAGRCMDCGVP